ncbi:Cytochrome oxidase assembly [Dimargaris cristalligena]|uniref:Cytochrome c oxidase assembly protein COX16, mitochondrial n=1 Tax=Dimargaris cristalligena TaxID=215637 RepID=A0A4P9ZK11_9FUNG|nr:Cytochrome oxidase assembly [Dimargaris cristalligena]RKP33584.1 cytochrome c oxidase assembly protein COX16-domain-containing protein [Dimargaris cristalligena]|eukprot:RKP33584.1 cytochrome c oxidase assembly protein COX16-domain-containing protein [Dimargaris cristalligena]
MPSFSERPWAYAKYSKYYERTLRNPFLFFGLPFIATMVLGSLALAPIAQTRYDLHDENKGVLTNEDELKMKVNRRPLSLQEEYWRLQEKDLDDWQNQRVQRPPGQDE